MPKLLAAPIFTATYGKHPSNTVAYERRNPGWWNNRGFKKRVLVHPNFYSEMKKVSTEGKQAGKAGWFPVFLELSKTALGAVIRAVVSYWLEHR
ncbi:hypothetical protein HNQ93_003623 [Hymenobacter luteus]|uniref:Uncharacterized protein n=2 Tax=Hymenobacter TaxID=89966 RepID=A0A7W9T468_9BACT|nr:MULTISPECIES: hypothetical protein [Hymenobacter]MBB4602856.1 hypothetical protein [Hymenobacter latericoloratus]MBB6060748.1 hypothetical protein [Hymenobacter luteus]